MEQRGPIYRALDGGGVAIGFNAAETYRLLNIDEFPPPAGVRSLLTFEAADHDAVARLTVQGKTLGATIIKAPYGTFYGSRQSVLRDPEGQVLRINAFQSVAAS
ncbi:MAG: Glyoxalase/bleomycin resistance protein/dioxygenase [Rhodospirillales bacterium]|nr:Glyoxalase/bleomycin resistance protein/dioxygenase [Rhodospirillales bacterium]